MSGGQWKYGESDESSYPEVLPWKAIKNDKSWEKEKRLSRWKE
jgi:hypothetical protein